MFDYLVMGMILHEELTGYDIRKRIEMGVGHLYKASPGQLYPALKKLTGKGLLTLREQMQGKRQKKYYQATEAGKAAFLAWLSAPYDPHADADHYLVKIFLLGELPQDLRRQRLGEYEGILRGQLQGLDAIEKQLPTENLSDRNYYEFASFYYGYQTLQIMLRWIGHIRAEKPLSAFLQGKEEEK